MDESRKQIIRDQLQEIKRYDDFYWLRYLKEHTIFDAENIKAQKDFLIQAVEELLGENSEQK